MKEIIIKNLKIFAYHGVRPEEKVNGQNFLIDLTYSFDENYDNNSDEIENTLSYSDVIRTIKKSMNVKSFNLIETAADYVCKTLFKNFVEIQKIQIVLKKPEAPVNAEFEYIGVKTEKKRSDFGL